ncbi:MAG: SDR family oxidoreductase [Armatimonadetes bacterium]|nr:SDR family oxidoreductase [Armatimonadota bacterium]
MSSPLEGQWALILGASSGFGEATSLELARQGMNVVGVHLDRKATIPNAERIQSEIQAMGRQAIFFNGNAAEEGKREEILNVVADHLATEPVKQVRVLLHSLAFGTLKSYIAEDPAAELTKAQMEMTVDVMAHSLVYWVQGLLRRGLMGHAGRVYAMTSEGDVRVWQTYGAVSAAKAALESHLRQLAVELAPKGITANAIRAGFTDTPASRKIPGSDQMNIVAAQKNPSGRLTLPTDVGKAIAILSHPDNQWMTGNVIGVDGGEFCVA